MYINCCTTPTLTASNTSPICSGQSLNFGAVPNPTGTNYTYSWTGPNNFTSTLQNPTIASPTILAAGTYTVTLTVPNCGTSNATTTATVNPGPAVSAIARIILGTSINPRPFQYFNVIAELEKADMIMIMSKTN